jgi:hypothetical protein
MVKTRQEVRRQVYEHLIEVILGLDMDHPIPQALEIESADSIPGIVSLREKDLVELRFKSVDDKDIEWQLPLGKGEQRLLTIIPSFILYKSKDNKEKNSRKLIGST